MKKLITATLVGGAIVGSLLGAGAANAETAGQENAIESAESYTLEIHFRVFSPRADRATGVRGVHSGPGPVRCRHGIRKLMMVD